MKRLGIILSLLLFNCFNILIAQNQNSTGQSHKMYGFTDPDTNSHTHFVAFDYSIMQYDTLISFNARVIPFMFNTAMDEYNGRYFYLGYPRPTGTKLYTVNVNNSTIDSVLTPLGTEIEYDPSTNSIVSIINSNNKKYAARYNLSTQSLDTICETYKNTTILGNVRTINYREQEYFYAASYNNNYYYFVVDLVNKTVDSIPVHRTNLNNLDIAHHLRYDINHNRIIGSMRSKLFIYQNNSVDTSNISFSASTSTLNQQQAFFDPFNDLYYRPIYQFSSQQSYLLEINIDSSTIVDSIPFYPINNGEWAYNQIPPMYQNGDTLGTIFGSNFQWYLNNNPIAASNSQTIKINTSGYYSVKVESLNGDTLSSGNHYFNNIVTDLPDSKTNSSDLLVYPNPFHDYCVFDLSTYNNQSLVLQLFNLNGQLLRSYSIKDQTTFMLEKGELKEGIYYYRLISESKTDSGKLCVN